jgi:hypothetical protein
LIPEILTNFNLTRQVFYSQRDYFL